MKIALLTPGGVDRSGTHRVIPCLLWLLERIAREHEVHVFALWQEERPCRYELLGAQVHNIGRGRTAARTLLALAREHRRAPFHLLHALWAVPAGTLAAAAGRILRRPVLLQITGGELLDLRDIRYGGCRTIRGRTLVRLALQGADTIVVPSEPVRAAAARLGFEARRLPLGADPRHWPPRPPRPRESGRPARLIHVASLNRVKDQPTLLRALARLAAAGTEFTLDVAGTDTLGGAVQRLAAELGLADRTTFHGFLPQDRLRTLMERADLLVLASRHEGDPIVLLEAALTGVPTVGTAVGRIAEWAPDAASAVPVGDDAALAREVATLLADDERRLALAHAAQARALAEDADWSAARMLELYDELAARPRRRTRRPQASARPRHGLP